MKETALVTGASSGIGLELARLHAQDGHNLVISARSESKLNDLKEELEEKYGISVEVFVKDLAEDNAGKELYDFIKGKNIQIDYLINNAGFADFAFFHDAEWKKLDNMMRLNMITLTHLTKLFLPEMVKQKEGRIMNVASTAAFMPGPTMAVYHATKAYVLHFSEAIANELKDSGVTVTAFCPAATESGFQERAEMEDNKLVKGKKLPTSSSVARKGYRKMMKGKRVAFPGLWPYLQSITPRFFPRRMVTWIVRNFYT